MAGPAILLEIITYIFQCTPPTCECDEPLTRAIHLATRLPCFHVFEVLQKANKLQVAFKNQTIQPFVFKHRACKVIAYE